MKMDARLKTKVQPFLPFFNLILTGMVLAITAQILISKGYIETNRFNIQGLLQSGDMVKTSPAFFIEETISPTSTFESSETIAKYGVEPEWKLVKTEQDGDYTVETYQAFENYLDAHGKTIRTRPVLLYPEQKPRYSYVRYYNGK